MSSLVPALDQGDRNSVPEVLLSMQPEPRRFSFDPSQSYTIRGRDGLALRILPGTLDLPSDCQVPGSQVDGSLTDYISPLEVVAAGGDFLTASSQSNKPSTEDDELASRQPDKPIILESAGMFDLKLYCNGNPVKVAEGMGIGVQKPETVPGNEFGVYRRTSNGWEESPLRRPANNSVVIRGRANLASGESGQISILDHDQLLEIEVYQPGQFSIRATPGKEERVWFVSPRHRPTLAIYKLPDQPGIINVASEELLPFPQVVDQDSILEAERFDQPPYGISANCGANVDIVHYDTGRPSYGLRIRKAGQEVETTYQGGFCLSIQELESEGGVNVEFDFGPESGERKKLTYHFDKSDVRKQIQLVTNREVQWDNGPVPSESIAVDPVGFSSGFQTYALLDATGFWNFDYPRMDLACVNIEIEGYSGSFLASIISLDRFSAYSQQGHNRRLKTAFLQGERSRVLVFSQEKDLYGISREFQVWNQYGHFKIPDSPCQDIDQIQMKPIPDYATKEPERFKKELGF